MKNNLRKVLMIAVVGIIFGCAADVSAQNAISPVGGYTAAAVTDTEVIAAANYAVKKQSKSQKAEVKLIAVNNAAHQVVAGMNYQICLSIEKIERKAKTPTPQTVLAVVYQNPKGKYTLTSWAIAACTEATQIIFMK